MRSLFSSDYLQRSKLQVCVRMSLASNAAGNMKLRKVEVRENGVHPEKTGGDLVLWLRGDSYVPFKKEHWNSIETGLVKL